MSEYLKVTFINAIEMEENFSFTDNVSFKVDAGLIDRLGRELVGRAETAVSELIKNSYDADAREVNVTFIDSESEGGTLIIEDDGVGMNFRQLIAGFMTISSTDKIHNPKSIRYGRRRAGRKGIGRFATQRLGKKLTIITQTADSEKALQLTIDWNNYAIDKNITEITNPVELVNKRKEEGTFLIIDDLRDAWGVKSIERVFRYVAELFQPDYLSEQSTDLGLARQIDSTFKVSFFKKENELVTVIANPQNMFFDKAVAIVEGFVDSSGDGYFGVKSSTLHIDDYAIPIEYKKDQVRFSFLKDIHFKAYYFIYNRPEYYSNISKLELKNIQNISSESSGIRLYRNGFRVLPYGEPKDDWLGLDTIDYGGETGTTNIPYSNKNFFGFVEVVDLYSAAFEETASREGLINNEAFIELREFVAKSLLAARKRIQEGITQIRERNKSKKQTKEDKPTTEESIKKLEDFVSDENSGVKKEDAQAALNDLKLEIEELLEELGMIRVLAALETVLKPI